jgi:hypothetical protein
MARKHKRNDKRSWEWATEQVNRLLAKLRRPDVIQELVQRATTYYEALRPKKGQVKPEVIEGCIDYGTDTLHDIVLTLDNGGRCVYRYDAWNDAMGVVEAPPQCRVHGFERRITMGV